MKEQQSEALLLFHALTCKNAKNHWIIHCKLRAVSIEPKGAALPWVQ
jgi:hypothetical protein